MTDFCELGLHSFELFGHILEKGDYTIASFDVMGTQAAASIDGESGLGTARASQTGNTTSAPESSSTLKVQIEYTDAKGERITVNRDVEIETASASAAAAGRPGQQNKSGVTSYLPYIAIILLAAGAFAYREKIQEKIQEKRQKKSGDKKSEEQKYALRAPRD